MAVFASETFTGTNGTTLATHNAAWVKHTNHVTLAHIFGNRLRSTGTDTIASVYYNNTTPPSADYSVSCEQYILSQSSVHNIGPAARMQTGASTFYWCRYRYATGIQLFKNIAGASTQLGSTFGASYTAGQTLKLTIKCEGSTISVFRNDETTPIISVTDTSITAAGYAGFWLVNPSDTVGQHLDNWQAETLTADETINCNQGSASAVGYAASILAATTIVCSLGSADALGHQATVTVGSDTTINCSLGSASAVGYQGTVTVAGSATITSDVFKNNTGTVLASTSIPKVAAVKLSDMTMAASWTSQTTDASGVLTVSSGSLTTSTDYLLVVSNADGSAVGVKKYTAA